MNAHTITTDIAILGGGMVGMTLALALAQRGMRVTVLERTSMERQIAPEFDGRVSAIAHGSANIFKALGVWEAMASDAQPILDIRVVDGESPLFLHYDHRAVGAPLGHIVENRVTREALLAAAEQQERLTIIAPANVATVTRDAFRATLSLADGRTITAALLIAADGKRSFLRAQAGIGALESDYKQSGIVCTVAHEHPHHGVAVEKFLPVGPFAMLPMTGNRMSLVWTERTDLAAAILALSDAEFLQELSRRFGDWLGALRVAGPRFSYPLDFLLADRYVDTRLVLVGDAAHGMHPIAGLGVNLGFRDVAVLTDLLEQRFRLGLDLGAADGLEAYERLRRFDVTLMMGVTDGLTRLFSNAVPPVKWARRFGLAAVNQLPPLKKLFMRHAMGILGDLPTLMRDREYDKAA
ncbi:MAG: UbiH/UbiF/VisC/COQ6 family ubiquinone biosynthesis hydroxylase [Alphaproteobacteria bacterium]|nr:UbiH/UbiF/VisC/COQ6 family ubiquinone biosynthesis hydroxylase [Alphaproteobacteria bacterium]